MWRGGDWRALDNHVRPDFRRTVVYGLLALAALITGLEVGGVSSASMRERLIAYGCAVLVAFFGIAASRTASREVHRISVARAGEVAATPLRLIVLLGGYLIALFSVLDLVGLGVRNLLLGGAVTGVILGLAAQPVLSNLFAGLVLLFSRPYVPGIRIRVMSGAINGPLEGVVVSAGLLYTVLETDDGPLNIPNNVLLASAVGPAPDSPSSPSSPDDADLHLADQVGAATGAVASASPSTGPSVAVSGDDTTRPTSAPAKDEE
ncbi:mechanosensitive ion channel family protein [Symbioplanes lichenis]|uniref:mechanosensitive ion channel family protein n=1 Tax=Symbioplanes lichenis TaxID=1629072 RepID=UPI0027382528|nr:mechanosensitive ion channel family protein [Actinoplanes lichenis]